MEALLSPATLARQVEALAAGAFLRRPEDLLGDGLALLRAPERISTVDCAESHRLMPGPEAGAVVRYDRWRTPYNVGPMNGLDDPKCRLLVMVKPSRSGGTTVAENYLFKMMQFGPAGWAAWYLNSDEAVTDYCRNVVKDMFALNPRLQARVGLERSDDTDTFKRVQGHPVEWLAAKDSTFRNREPIFMVSDETDAWGKKFAATPKVQIDGRQKQLGNRRKAAIMSHPDLGWGSGVGGCYEDSSRGIYVMRCPDCHGFATPYATKFWPDTPEFKLHWTKALGESNDKRLEIAEQSASMLCPHCGSCLSDEQRREMVDEALREGWGHDGWMHRGQTLDAVKGILGEMEPHPTRGFWVHGLMLKSETLANLARNWEAALIKFERSRNPAQLKEFMSKALGEIFEGAATTGGVSPNALKARVRDSGYQRGVVPKEALFVTAAVDTGGKKFDVAWIAWDLEGRSWLLDRQTIRQRQREDGTWRDIHTSGEVDDWIVLLPIVAERRFPIEGCPDLVLPVAVTCIDSGDGNVTWKAREFARRSFNAGYHWSGWPSIKLIKGFDGKKPILPEAPRKIDKDEHGRQVLPEIFEYNLGADALKALTYERLAITDGSPGQCHFPEGLEPWFIDEFFGESLIDGKWKRNGPNEQLDLYGYAEAGRLMLRPDRVEISWGDPQARPVWARPIPILSKGGDHEAPAQGGEAPSAKSIFDRFNDLNKG